MRPTDFWTKYHSPQEIVVKLATVPLLAQRLLLCSDVYCLSVTHWRPQDCKTKSLSSKWFCWGDQIWNRFVSPPCATKTHIFTSNYPLVPSPFLNLEKKFFFYYYPNVYKFHSLSTESHNHHWTLLLSIAWHKFLQWAVEIFLIFTFIYLFSYWPWHTVCGIQVPQPGIKTGNVCVRGKGLCRGVGWFRRPTCHIHSVDTH